MDVIDRIKVHLLAFAFDVDHFATDHAVGTQQVSEDFDRLRVAGLAHQLESENAKGIASHDGGGFAELLVARRLTAPKVIVIDAGQVIVNQAEGMEHFEGAHGVIHRFALSTEHVKRSANKCRTESLSTGEHRITHRLVEPFRTVGDGRQKFFKLLFRNLRDAGKVIKGSRCFFFKIFHKHKDT